MRRGCDRVEGSIGRSYDEIKGVTMLCRHELSIHGSFSLFGVKLTEVKLKCI